MAVVNGSLTSRAKALYKIHDYESSFSYKWII